MFTALYVYGFVASAAVWWFVWSLGGTAARTVITAGLYRYHPEAQVKSYMRPARARKLNRLLRGHPDHRDRRIGSDALLAEFVPVGSNATTVVCTVPALVSAEMAADGSNAGAEHWGDLLKGMRDEMAAEGYQFQDMNTEERTVYNLQMVLDHEEHKAVEHQFLTGLDRAVAAVIARINEENALADEREAFWRRSAERRGTDWETATQAWELVPA